MWTMLATMSGCETWKGRIEEAVSRDIGSDQTRLAAMIDCWLPATFTGEYLLAATSVLVSDVRILGSEGKEARRYRANVEVIIDRARSSPTVRGLPSAPVRLTVEGVITHSTNLRVMYVVPWIFSESQTNATLISRNGSPITMDANAQMFSPPAAENPPVLAPRQPWVGSFALTMNMSDGQDSSARVYDVIHVPAQAGTRIRLEITSRGPSAIAFQLFPPDDVYPQVLGARVVPANGSAHLDYVSPAAGALRVIVWKMKLDPAGTYTVQSVL
jgi:hypothetical protein